MSEMPQHITWTHIPKASWIAARGFAAAGGRPHKRALALAVMSWPAFALMSMLTGPKSIYRTASFTGVVTVLRQPSWGMYVRFVGFFAVVFLAIPLVGVYGPSYPIAFVVLDVFMRVFTVLALATMVSVGVTVCIGKGKAVAPEDAPFEAEEARAKRPYLLIGMAAQVPGKSAGMDSGVLYLVNSVIEASKPGTQFMATPLNEKLRRIYRRRGFLPTSTRAMVYTK